MFVILSFDCQAPVPIFSVVASLITDFNLDKVLVGTQFDSSEFHKD